MEKSAISLPSRQKPLKPDVDALVRAHAEALRRYLRLHGCDPALADDLAQETFMHALVKPFEDRGPAATAAYLRSVARFRFLEHQRSLGKRREVELERAADAVDAVWSANERDDEGEGYCEALRECLKRLTGRARKALRLRYGESMSRSQIAVELGLAENGLKTLLQRSRAGLRDCINRKLGK